MSDRPQPDVILRERRFGDVAPDSPWRFKDLPEIVFSHRVVALALICGLALVSAWLAVNFPPRMALGLFLGLIGGVAILFEPFFGVLAYYLLGFLRPQDVFWGFQDARFTMLVSSFTLASTAIKFAMKPDLRFLWQRQNFFVVVLWVFLWLSTIYGDFGVPQPKWMDYWNKLFLIYFISLAMVNSERRLYILGWVLMGSIGYLAIWANERYFLDGWHVVHGPGRPGSAFYDENDFAMVIVMAVPFMWYIMRTTTHWFVRLGLLGLLPLAAHAVMVTFSRGGFLGLSAVMGLIAIREKNRKLGFTLLGAGVVFFLLLAGEEYRNRIGSIDEYEEDRSAAGRIEAWDTGLDMMAHNPFFGVGLKQFVEAFPYYANYEPREAHNSWVQLGSEAGLLALGAYGMLVLLTVASLRRVTKRIPHLPPGRNREITENLVRIYEASLLGYLVCGFFLSMEDFEFFYLLVAMSQILDRVTGQRMREHLAEQQAALERDRARREAEAAAAGREADEGEGGPGGAQGPGGPGGMPGGGRPDPEPALP